MSRMRLSHGSASDSNYEVLGPKDLRLAEGLVAAGPSHAKFMRSIVAWLTIKAPRYWWLQFDTYKVGTTALSESTMHTIMRGPLGGADFVGAVSSDHIGYLNKLVRGGKFHEVKANLPEGFLQTRGVCLNYQVLRTIYHQRRTHRLKEWQDWCDWVKTLPYAQLIIESSEATV
jgi:hypothetical protein